MSGFLGDVRFIIERDRALERERILRIRLRHAMELLDRAAYLLEGASVNFSEEVSELRERLRKEGNE